MPIPQKILARDDVFYSNPHFSIKKGKELLNRIVRRDPTVLDTLSGDEMMKRFYVDNPEKIFSQEWGIASESKVDNPDCILIAGNRKSVEWAPFLAADLIPLGHSHPYYEGNATRTRALPGKEGVSWNDINGQSSTQNTGARLKVFPSAGDIAFCVNQKLAVHSVSTPYCFIFANEARTERMVVNYNINPRYADEPRLHFRIFDAKEVNKGHYRASIAAVVGQADIWRKHDVQAFSGGSGGLVF